LKLSLQRFYLTATGFGCAMTTLTPGAPVLGHMDVALRVAQWVTMMH